MTTIKFIKQLTGETVIYGLSSALTRMISIFLVPLYTLVFSPSEYGIIAIIASFDGLITTFVVLGMDNASARWYYDESNTELFNKKQVMSTWFWFQLAVSVLISVLIIFFSDLLSVFLTDSADLKSLIIITGLTIPLNAFKKVLGNWLRYQRKAWNTISFSIVTSLVTIGLTIYFVLILRIGLAGIYWADLIALFLMSIVAGFIFKDWISPLHFSISLLKQMSRFAFPLVPSSIAGWVTASADRFILKGYVKTDEIGLYFIAASLASILTIIISAFQMAWGPFAYSILSEPSAKKIYSKVFSLYFLIGTFSATTLSIFAPLILKIFTTSSYSGASSSVSFLAFSSIAIGSTYIAALPCGIAKKSTPLSVSIFLGAIINTILNFFLIPIFGKNGAAIATMVAYSTSSIYLFIIGNKLYPIPFHYRDAIVCYVISWALIGIDYIFLPSWGFWPFLIRVGICFFYIPLGISLKIIRKEMIFYFVMNLLQKIRKRFSKIDTQS